MEGISNARQTFPLYGVTISSSDTFTSDLRGMLAGYAQCRVCRDAPSMKGCPKAGTIHYLSDGLETRTPPYSKVHTHFRLAIIVTDKKKFASG